MSDGIASSESAVRGRRHEPFHASKRIYGLDALRAVVRTLRLVIDLGVDIGPGNAVLHRQVEYRFIHLFRIPALFVLVGFFAALVAGGKR